MYRYRIVRDRGSRDGDAMIVPVHVAGEPWWCVCGEDNVDDDSHCWFCNAERGEWTCDCGHRNPKRVGDCEECGKARPEE